MTLNTLDGLDTIEEASSAFDSKIVGNALNRLINVIIEISMEISKAYSGLNKCAFGLIRLPVVDREIP